MPRDLETLIADSTRGLAAWKGDQLVELEAAIDDVEELAAEVATLPAMTVERRIAAFGEITAIAAAVLARLIDHRRTSPSIGARELGQRLQRATAKIARFAAGPTQPDA